MNAAAATPDTGPSERRRPAAPAAAVAVLLAVGAASSLAAAGCTRPARDPFPERPSMVLIVVDTVRADHVGAYGYSRPTTPRIDRWASRGVVFERAYSTSSWTLPAFGSMLTGLWPAVHGAGIYPGEHRQVELVSLDESLPTLPALLSEAGYATGAIMNNPILQPSLRLDRGFDDYDYAESSNENIRDAAEVVDLAIAWIEKAGEGPFFLLVHIMDPHLDYNPPASVRGRFTGGYAGPLEQPVKVRLRDAKAQAALEGPDRDFVVALYDEELLYVDQELGRLLERIDERSDVLTVLTSDHGEEFWDHGDFEHGHTMYEELLRVPLIAVGPGIDPRRIGAAVSTIDVMPTLAEAAGVAVPDPIGGVSLLATLGDGAVTPVRPLFAGGILYGVQQAAVVAGNMKGIVSLTSGEWQIYDLAADPGETLDLAEDASREPARIIERMQSLLVGAGGHEAAAGRAAERVDVVEGLKALGYVDDEGRRAR